MSPPDEPPPDGFEPDVVVEGKLRSEQVNAASERGNVDAMDKLQADLGFDFQPEARAPAAHGRPRRACASMHENASILADGSRTRRGAGDVSAVRPAPPFRTRSVALLCYRRSARHGRSASGFGA